MTHTPELIPLGWDQTHASAYHPFDRVDAAPARVLRADRGICTVLYAGAALYASAAQPAGSGPTALGRASLAGSVLLGAARDPAALPCAGDWVVVRRWPDRRLTVEVVLPRRTALIRRTADKDSSGQVLAANMDTVAVVEPMEPAPDEARIERLVALAFESGARPLLVLSKSDTAGDPAAIARQLAEAAPGVRVLPVSVQRGTGLDELRGYVTPGRTLALVGRSGAGKSTLLNALVGATAMPTQTVRRADGKGRHTTAYRALVPVPGGGAVLDTPGIRGVGLLDTADGLDRAFADVAAFADGCRFGDCGHDGEPGCAVAAALAEGLLTPRRLESWRRLHREVATEGGRRAVRPAAVGERARRSRHHR